MVGFDVIPRSMCVEGLDGSGKTAMIEYVRKYLEQREDRKVIVYKEPPGVFPKSLISLATMALKNGVHVDASTVWEIVDKLEAARANNYPWIIDAIEDGDADIVIFDRCHLSTLAYQSTMLTLAVGETIGPHNAPTLDSAFDIVASRLLSGQIPRPDKAIVILHDTPTTRGWVMRQRLKRAYALSFWWHTEHRKETQPDVPDYIIHDPTDHGSVRALLLEVAWKILG